MTALRHNLIVEQGSDFVLPMVWKDPAGNAINLTGYHARLMFRKSYDAPGAPVYSAVDHASMGAGDIHIVLGGVAGTITLTIPNAKTQTFPAPWPGVYDMELVSPGGVVTRLVEGEVKITPEVTKINA